MGLLNASEVGYSFGLHTSSATELRRAWSVSESFVIYLFIYLFIHYMRGGHIYISSTRIRLKMVGSDLSMSLVGRPLQSILHLEYGLAASAKYYAF